MTSTLKREFKYPEGQLQLRDRVTIVSFFLCICSLQVHLHESFYGVKLFTHSHTDTPRMFRPKHWIPTPNPQSHVAVTFKARGFRETIANYKTQQFSTLLGQKVIRLVSSKCLGSNFLVALKNTEFGPGVIRMVCSKRLASNFLDARPTRSVSS